MSTVFIIRSPELSDINIFGFTRCAENTVWRIYYKNDFGLEVIYTDKEENGLFPEEFSNKRLYLEFLKKNNKKYIEFRYRLTNKQIQDISSCFKKSFSMYIGSADDLNCFQIAPKIRVKLLNITDKTLFQEKILYEVSV